MAVSFEEDLDQVEREEGGRGLRKRYEAALAELKDRDKRLSSFEAAKVIEDHGLSLVTPDDLAGVAVGELEERAQAVQAEKLAAQEELARSVFAKKGLEGTELDKAVEDFLTPAEPVAPTGGDLDAVRELGRISGRPSDPRIPQVPADATNLDLLRAAEAQSAAQR